MKSLLKSLSLIVHSCWCINSGQHSPQTPGIFTDLSAKAAQVIWVSSLGEQLSASWCKTRRTSAKRSWIFWAANKNMSGCWTLPLVGRCRITHKKSHQAGDETRQASLWVRFMVAKAHKTDNMSDIPWRGGHLTLKTLKHWDQIFQET